MLSGWIGWLGASVAGLTALCYGSGYFVVHTHLNMLGLSGVLDVSTDQLLLEGGRFLFATISLIVETGLIIAIFATVIWLIASIIYRLSAKKNGRLSTLISRTRDNDAVRSIVSYVLPVTIIAIIFYHHDAYYDRLDSLTQLQSLLFFPVEAAKNSLAAEVGPFILDGTVKARSRLIVSYQDLVAVYTVSIIFVWIVVYIGATSTFGKLANILLIIYSILLTAFLPVAFGVLVRTPVYPVANIVLDGGQNLEGFLLQRRDHDVVIWDPKAHRAVTVGTDGVSRLEVVGEQDIFRKRGQT